MTSGEIVVSALTILAIVVGPILAVIVTRKIDDERAAKARKMDIFRTLMRTRKMTISADHVGALNLVEIEFIIHGNVIGAWKAYLAHLSGPLLVTEDQARIEATLQQRSGLLTRLLFEIAQVLELKIEQMDILEGSYLPQGWTNDDSEQRLVRQHLLNVLSGRAPIVVKPENAVQGANPYPPAPPRS